MLSILQVRGNARDAVFQHAIGVICANFKCNICICKLMLYFIVQFEDASGFKTCTNQEDPGLWHYIRAELTCPRIVVLVLYLSLWRFIVKPILERFDSYRASLVFQVSNMVPNHRSVKIPKS